MGRARETSTGAEARLAFWGLDAALEAPLFHGAAYRVSATVVRLVGSSSARWARVLRVGVRRLVSISLGIGGLLARPWKSGPSMAASGCTRIAGFSPRGRPVPISQSGNLFSRCVTDITFHSLITTLRSEHG